jgi:ubiquinone/menaquinone biosynthesis C-methylase UbiE
MTTAPVSTPTTAREWEQHLAAEDVQGAEVDTLLDQVRNRYLAPLVKPGLRILEAGCGNGRYVLAFALKGAVAYGIDFSARLAAKTEVRAREMGLRNVVTVSGNILRMQFADNLFNLYTSFGVYEHFTRPQHRLLFTEAYRVIAPGGLFYLEVPHLWSPWTVRRELRYQFRKRVPPSIVWQHNLSRAYVMRCAKRAGFQTVESHVFDAWYGFKHAFSLEAKRVGGVPNPFYALAPLFRRLAEASERREWLGHTLVYIGRKP